MILPPATIGMLGGGQLGRMTALAARSMGYGIHVLDPDAHCACAPVADRVIAAKFDDVDAARDEVQRAITRVSQGVGVLLMTDMFGGTPTNIASMFLEDGKVEVITGINLPMVIKLGTQTGQGSLNELARRVCELGRQGIYVAGDLLTPQKDGKA